MKLDIRYDFGFQTIELDAKEAEGLWVCLSLEDGNDLSEEEKEQRLQERFDELFNEPELSNWRRHNRKDKFDHDPKVKRGDGKVGIINPSDSDEQFEALDYLAITSDEEKIDQDFEHEEVCAWVRKVLKRKPMWADVFICVCIDGERLTDYAERNGISVYSAGHKLSRAKRDLRQAWLKR